MACIIGKKEANKSDDKCDIFKNEQCATINAGKIVSVTTKETENSAEWYNELPGKLQRNKLNKTDSSSSSDGRCEYVEGFEMKPKKQKSENKLEILKEISNVTDPSGENTEEKDECSASKVEEEDANHSQLLKAEKKKRKKKRIEIMEVTETLIDDKIQQICSDSEDDLTVGSMQERDSCLKKSRKRKRKKRENQDFADEEMPLQGDRSDLDVTGSGYDGDVEESERKRSKRSEDDMAVVDELNSEEIICNSSLDVPFEAFRESDRPIENTQSQKIYSNIEVKSHSIKLKAKLSKLRLTEDSGPIAIPDSEDHQLKVKEKSKKSKKKQQEDKQMGFQGSNLSKIAGYGDH